MGSDVKTELPAHLNALASDGRFTSRGVACSTSGSDPSSATVPVSDGDRPSPGDSNQEAVDATVYPEAALNGSALHASANADASRQDAGLDVLDATADSDVASESEITFGDPALKSCVLATLKNILNVPPARAALQSIKHLACYAGNLKYLDGIEQLTALEILELRDQSIVDLAPLAQLPRLSYLKASYCKLTSVSGLAGCTSLKSIILSDNDIADIEPLKSCSNLTELVLARNPRLADITPLTSLTKLEILSLGQTNISTLEPIGSLSSLEFLGFSTNKISDVSSLRNLRHLSELLFSGSHVIDISPLAGLGEMEILDMANNAITSIDVIASMPNLSDLSVIGNKVQDVSAIRTLLCRLAPAPRTSSWPAGRPTSTARPNQ